MTYLDRPRPPKGPPWAHNSLGASVHNALAGWWRLPLAERTPAAAGRLLVTGWLTDGYADDAQSDRYRERSRRMVERYTESLNPVAEPAGIERTVATKTDRIAVSGRIDRLDDRPVDGTGPDGSYPGPRRDLVVVDYKTGRRSLTVDEARSSMALALYALAAGRVLRRPCHRVELHHLPSGEVHGWTHTDLSLDRHLSRVEDIAAECAAADRRYAEDADHADHAERSGVFAPLAGPGCGWCDFRPNCPEGQLAGPVRRPWDGLESAVAEDE